MAELEKLFLPALGEELRLGQGDLAGRGVGVLFLFVPPDFLNDAADALLGGYRGPSCSRSPV